MASTDPRRRPAAAPAPPPPPEETPSTTPPGSPPPTAFGIRPAGADDPFRLRFCTVCASNNNRSMEAHLQLSKAGFPVISFGTGSLVRLPGPTISQPNIYNFNVTSYDSIFHELESKDVRLYKANGLLPMIDRNRHLKWGPERWQDWPVGVPRVSDQQKHNKGSAGTEAGVVDVVFTCEEKCWDSVVEDLLNRGSPLNRPVHVFNIEIKDNHEEAVYGGRAILDLATRLDDAAAEERARAGRRDEEFDVGQAAARAGFDERVPDILAAWQDKWPRLPALWTLAWF